jgi:hypothetical protein
MAANLRSRSPTGSAGSSSARMLSVIRWVEGRVSLTFLRLLSSNPDFITTGGLVDRSRGRVGEGGTLGGSREESWSRDERMLCSQMFSGRPVRTGEPVRPWSAKCSLAALKNKGCRSSTSETLITLDRGPVLSARDLSKRLRWATRPICAQRGRSLPLFSYQMQTLAIATPHAAG